MLVVSVECKLVAFELEQMCDVLVLFELDELLAVSAWAVVALVVLAVLECTVVELVEILLFGVRCVLSAVLFQQLGTLELDVLVSFE